MCRCLPRVLTRRRSTPGLPSRWGTTAIASKSSAQKRALMQLLNVFFGGSPSQAAAALLKQENWSDDELEALRGKIDVVRKQRRP